VDLFFSVVLPTFNRAHLVPRAVDSALEQLAPEDELIVVDDGSTDHTQDVLASYGDRIRCIRTGNRGAGAARNRGIQEARNELIAFLDSDDEWLPGKLDLQRALMAACPDIVFCCTDFIIRIGDSTRRHGLEYWMRDHPRLWEEIMGPGVSLAAVVSPAQCSSYPDCQCYFGNLYHALMSIPCVANWTAVVRRSSAGSALRFAEDLPLFEDWECFALLAQKGAAAFLDCETAINHGHQGPRLTNADALCTASTRLKLLDRIWGKNTDFLRQNNAEFECIRNEQLQLRIRALIASGDTRQARIEMANLPDVRTLYRLLGLLPGFAAQTLAGIRRNFLRTGV
jgi:glycosyltransferase involved in cell wall biosynthesis